MRDSIRPAIQVRANAVLQTAGKIPGRLLDRLILGSTATWHGYLPAICFVTSSLWTYTVPTANYTDIGEKRCVHFLIVRAAVFQMLL